MASPPFRFKRFLVDQAGAAHPVGTDSVLLGAWPDMMGAKSILDIGSGTGIVALMLAQRCESESGIRITGVELQEQSSECARRNFTASPWSNRLSVHNQSIQEFTKSCREQFDLIVSNPPYFPETTVSPDLNRRISRNAVALTLRELLVCVRQLLAPAGRCCFILPALDGPRFCEQGALLGLYCTRSTCVFSRENKPAERILIQLERDPYPYSGSEMLIYEKDDCWSAGFRTLTSDFYLGFDGGQHQKK